MMSTRRGVIGRRAAGLATVALTLVLLPGCSKATPPAPPDETTLRAEDKRDLERIVASDVRASRAMQDADEATQKGDAGAASEAIASRARPAVEEGIRTAEAVAPRTAWGQTKRAELLAILRDRKAEMPRYEQALESHDPERMLTAIVAQAAIERRALATVAAVQDSR